MARGLVYTAVVGNYDQPKPVRLREDGVDYVMATDGKGADGWDIVRVSADPDPRTRARRIKVAMPSTDIKHYDWTCWVDGTMEIVGPVKEFAEKALEHHDFAAWKHPWWQCSYTEVDKCIALKKDKRDRLELGRARLRRHGMPKNYGQLATWVLLRKDTALAREHAVQWWQSMLDTTMRDQVTFMLNLWLLKGSIQWLSGTVHSANWMKFHTGHRK